jgi:hypothetical protein
LLLTNQTQKDVEFIIIEGGNGADSTLNTLRSKIQVLTDMASIEMNITIPRSPYLHFILYAIVVQINVTALSSINT